MQDIPAVKTPEALFEALKTQHPALLRVILWQNDQLILDARNPDARVDRETNFLKKFFKALIRVMPFMRSPLSDFRGSYKNVRSVTKTIVSLLAGMVFQEDILARLDDPIRIYFPEIPADDPKAAIRLKHILSNTSGMPTIDDLHDMHNLFATKNWLQTILHFPLLDEPGNSYIYSSANFHLVTCLLERVLGSSLLKFAADQLFSPLGISAFYWSCDPQGVPFGGSDLYLKPENMLTVGKLCLQNGIWEKKQIVPSIWLETATKPIWKVSERDQYGYGWWIDHGPMSNNLHSFSACGVGGQRIIVIPEKKAVTVTTSLTGLHANSDAVDDLTISYFTKN